MENNCQSHRLAELKKKKWRMASSSIRGSRVFRGFNESRRRIGCLLVLVALSATPAVAELPVARLSSVFPPGGRIGATFEVTVSGIDLDDASEIHFSKAGITAKPKLVEGTGRPEANKFVITIAPDVSPGLCEARVVGRFGISNPRAFAIGDRPEILEKGGNNSPSSAMEIAVGQTLNGRCDANAVDYFKLTAKKGQRVLIGCLAGEIDSRMDAVLALYDTAGHELERSRREGLLDFTAPADGEYTLQTHDFLYRGGEDYFYRLSLSTGPRLDFVFPPAGLAGTKEKYVLYGRNLPGGAGANLKIDGKPLEQLAVEIELPNDPASRQRPVTGFAVKPANATLDGIEYRLKTPAGFSNPLLVSYATAPLVLEKEPNNKPDAAQKISLPCELVGQFYPHGDRDLVRFEAKRGDVYWIEVFSQRLGLPTDPYVLIQRVTRNDQPEEKFSDVKELYDSEASIGGPEFNTGSRDPAWRFEVKDDGVYQVEVRDLFNPIKDNPGLIYRLSLRKESPDFRLVALVQGPPPANKDKKEYPVWTPFLRRGESIAIKVLALRQDNFDGDIELMVEGLPPGLHQSNTKIDAGKTSALLVVTAKEDAAEWRGQVKVVGKAKIGEAEVRHAARGGSIIWPVPDANNEAVQSRLVREFSLAVSGRETVPLILDLGPNKVWETSVAGKVEIPVQVTRSGEFKGNIKLKPAGLAALDNAKEIEINTSTNKGVVQLDLAQTKLSPGYYTFHLQGQTQGKYRRLTEGEAKSADTALKAAEEAVKAAEKLAGESGEAAKQTAAALEQATKAMQETEMMAKASADKLDAAKAAAEKTPVNAELVAAKEAAEKVAAEAAAKLKAAAEAKAAAAKTAQESSAKAKEAETKKATAQKLVQEAKETVQKAQLKDLSFTTYSPPVTLKVAAAPVTLSPEAPTTQLEPGQKIEIPVLIKRLYGFSDAVELSLVLPNEVKGVNAAKVTIPKDQTQAKVVVEAAANATTGNHKLNLRASLKFNGQDLKADQPVVLKIGAVEKKKL